jgi:hypothetical protein
MAIRLRAGRIQGQFRHESGVIQYENSACVRLVDGVGAARFDAFRQPSVCSLRHEFVLSASGSLVSSAVCFASHCDRKTPGKTMRLSKKLMATLAVASPLAYGQTSVSLYGRLDAGVEYLNHINDGAGGSASQYAGPQRQ